jgi:hypothetical protein
MVLGEKLWEGNAKSMGTAIKAVTAEGITLEYTWMAQLTGMGKAKGTDLSVLFSGTAMMGPTGAGPTMGQGMLNTMTGDMAVMKASGYGWVEAGKGKGVSIGSFMTMSEKLGWMNKLVTIGITEGDPQWMESTIAVHEWK